MNIFKTSRSKVEKFKQQRARVSDDDFIIACELPTDPLATKAALGTRRAIANCGFIDSQYILLTDDFPGTLSSLPLWDSMDWVEFIMGLEEELGVDIPDADSDQLPTVFTVKEMVFSVYNLLKNRSENNLE